MGNSDSLTRIEPEYVFKVERGHDGQPTLVNVHAGTEQAARLKAINETVGPALIVELARSSIQSTAPAGSWLASNADRKRCISRIEGASARANAGNRVWSVYGA